ncbi:DUF4352 domain-containing protein [Paractinoplanes toevensis]|uniref:DUF4352 domain-containing protein n=1 Tax=Paractinoplanes toevensis TaxID=571911 RepID=UPI001BB456E8|nr:DUF4352 domain-containing protein [Actinoplanes toevensis]
MRWPWIAATVLAVVALGSGAYAAVRDGGEGEAAVPQAAPASSGSAGAAAGRVEEAQSARVGADGAFIVSVVGLRCGLRTVGPAELRQSAKGEFCLVNVAIENAGREPRLLDGSAQRAVDTHGRAYAIDDRAAAFLNERVPSLLDEIPAATTVRGVLPFEVPAGTRLSALMVHESAQSPGARIPLN